MPLSVSAHFWNYSHLPSCQGAGVNTIPWPRQETYMPSYLLSPCSWSFFLSPIDPLLPSLFWTKLWHCTSYCLQVFPASSVSPTLLYSSIGGSSIHPNTTCNCYPFPCRPLVRTRSPTCITLPHQCSCFLSEYQLFPTGMGELAELYCFVGMCQWLPPTVFFNPCKIIAAANQILFSPLSSVKK